MNAKLAISISLVAGIAFAGCGPTAAVTKPEPTTKPTAVASPKPTINPSTVPLNKDESEVSSIGEEFKNIDASKDFPDFTQNDLQQ